MFKLGYFLVYRVSKSGKMEEVTQVNLRTIRCMGLGFKGSKRQRKVDHI